MEFWKREEDDETPEEFPGIEVNEGWAPTPDVNLDFIQDEPVDEIQVDEPDSVEAEAVPLDDEAPVFDVVTIKRVAHPDRWDLRDIALEYDPAGEIVGFYLVEPYILEDRYSPQQLVLDEHVENVYNELVHFTNNQNPNLKAEVLSSVLLQLARAGIGILPVEPSLKSPQLTRKLSRMGVQL